MGCCWAALLMAMFLAFLALAAMRAGGWYSGSSFSLRRLGGMIEIAVEGELVFWFQNRPKVPLLAAHSYCTPYLPPSLDPALLASIPNRPRCARIVLFFGPLPAPNGSQKAYTSEPVRKGFRC
jgi:hypothetical protein